MKKVLAWLLVLAMTAALAVGGTLAYLTDTDEDVNVMTVGKVKIDQLEYERVDVESENDDATVQEFHDNKPLYPAVTEDGFDYVPGDTYVDWDQIGKDGYTSQIWNPDSINNEVDKMVFVKNKGDFDAYVRTVFAFEAGNYASVEEYLENVHLSLNETDFTWTWVEAPMTIGEGTYFVAVATYNEVLEPGAITEISLSQIALDSAVTNEDVAAFGDTFQVLVQSQAVQADGFDNAETALNEAFGEIPPEPFGDDKPTTGIDLKTALHYYEGDGAKITTKVANVYFAENGEYADQLAGLEGTLVDIEQDVPVYAYYVPNGSNYDVYFVASDDIIAPASSKNLFSGMSNLVTVDAENLDVSRVTTMYEMFYNCGKLTTLKASGWDTGNVKTMSAMFDSCKSLTTLDASDWNTGNVTSMSYMMMNCKALKSVDCSNWDVSKVKTLYCAFYSCSNLTELDLTGWNPASATNMSYMFAKCGKLTSLDVADWDVSKVANMSYTFSECTSLTELPISNWDTGSATNTSFMFYNNKKLTALDVADWDMSNVTTAKNMFTGCSAITELDLAKWNVSKVTDFEGMFSEMDSVTTIKLDNWQPNSAQSMWSVFYGCNNLQSIDASGWYMPNLTTVSHMFADCNKAAVIDVSGWYTPSLLTLDAMFNDCNSVTELDMSSFDTSNVVEFSQIFERCTSLKKIIGLENWNTAKGETFEDTFNGCSSLKELNLSSFDTSGARNSHNMIHGSTGTAFLGTFSGLSSLEKLILGAGFSFDGDGNVTSNLAKLPNPGNIDGQTAVWYNADNDTYYTGAEIPEETAATYIAVVKP